MTQARFYSSATKRTTTTVDPGTSGTTLTVADTTSFAVLDGNFPYTLLINWGLSDQEIVNATARPTGTTFTVVRGQDGSTGQAHPTGATVDHGVSARDFTEAGAHIGASFGVHGLTGSVVGTTDTQTLSGKTLSGLTTSYATKTAAYTLTALDAVIAGDATSSAFTLTLPTAVGVTGKTYTLKKIDTSVNTITIATTSSQTIDGTTTVVMRTPNLAIQVVSDGANWQIVNVASSDPWHTMTLQNGWINSAGNQAGKYRAIGLNLIQVVGVLTSGTTANSTVIATLPVGYRMLNINVSASQPVYVSGGGSTVSQVPAMWLENTGTLKIWQVPTAATQLQFNITFGTDG